MAAVAELLAKLKAAAEVVERVHRENLKLFTEEALRLLSRGDVRDAAEKAWAAYKSLLGLLVAKKLLPTIEEEAKRIAERKGVEEARKYVEWWITQGLLIPSTRQRLAEIARRLAEVTGDREIAERRAQAAILHVLFYHGPEIAEVSEEEASEMIQSLVDWVKRKARQYGLL